MPCDPPSLERRAFLELLASGTAAIWLGASGCSYYPAEQGAAFEPWRYPKPGEPTEMQVARAAILAASPHNTQPWRLRVSRGALELHANFGRNLGTMDSLRRELHIGLGCALENIVVAARALGAAPSAELLPDESAPTCVARVRLGQGERADQALFEQIARRHTNRGPYAERALAQAHQAQLQAIVRTQPGLRLRLLGGRAEREAFRAHTIAATRAIIADAQMSADSERWYRHTHEEIERERDGVTLDATGSGLLTRVLGKSLGRPDIATANAFWLKATRERQTTASLFGILSSSAASTRLEQLRVGCAFARVQLWASSEGLAVQPLNQLAERQDREQSQGLEPVFSRALEDLIGARGRRAQMLFRIGHPLDTAFASPRRPLAWVSS